MAERINELGKVGKQLVARGRRVRVELLERLRELALREQAAAIGVHRVKALYVAREEALVFAELVREQNLAKERAWVWGQEAADREIGNRAGCESCVEC